jgi:hypothetical protein
MNLTLCTLFGLNGASKYQWNIHDNRKSDTFLGRAVALVCFRPFTIAVQTPKASKSFFVFVFGLITEFEAKYIS